jgi:hypothetical protein
MKFKKESLAERHDTVTNNKHVERITRAIVNSIHEAGIVHQYLYDHVLIRQSDQTVIVVGFRRSASIRKADAQKDWDTVDRIFMRT